MWSPCGAAQVSARRCAFLRCPRAVQQARMHSNPKGSMLKNMMSALIGRPTLKERTVVLFGHFGHGNFGNESTLQAMLYHLRRLLPEAQFNCVCTDPSAVAMTHNINALPMNRTLYGNCKFTNGLAILIRHISVGVATELCRWADAFKTLKHAHVLIIPGTGLLTDAFGLRFWGPYTLFRWSLVAKICGCKLMFVSVGAGPIYSRTGRWLVRCALGLANFRSYRDDATREYLKSIGCTAVSDRVYPDLVFSIAEQMRGTSGKSSGRRPVVGLGLMSYSARLSGRAQDGSTYVTYLEQLQLFAKWLLTHDYDIRLLIGELGDSAVTREFKALINARWGAYDKSRIMDEPAQSSDAMLAQLAQTDAVVATRFHNVVWALALNKPVISISFHQKCRSLMQDMGLLDYLQDIEQLDASVLIQQFCRMQQNADFITQLLQKRVAACQHALDEQYAILLRKIWPAKARGDLPVSAIKV